MSTSSYSTSGSGSSSTSPSSSSDPTSSNIAAPRKHPPCNCVNKQQFLRCRAELSRLRRENLRAQQREEFLGEKRYQDWAEHQYRRQMKLWQESTAAYAQNMAARRNLMQDIAEKRKALKRFRQEQRQSYYRKANELRRQHAAEDEQLAKELFEKAEELKQREEKMVIDQQDKWLNAQMKPKDPKSMNTPELEGIRRTMMPVSKGPNETYECVMVEPGPTRKELELTEKYEREYLEHLKKQHAIHFKCSDKCKKKCTVKVAMAPRCLEGECAKVTWEPGAGCLQEMCREKPTPPIPECLKGLVKTLDYQVSNIDAPLLNMKSYGPGPHFYDTKLYGTIVVPKGQQISQLYTDRYCVTY